MLIEKNKVTVKTKIVVFFLFGFVVSFFNDIFLFLLLYIYLIYCIYSFKKIPNWRLLLLGDSFIFFMVILMPFLSKQGPFYKFLGLKISKPIFIYSVALFLKVTLLLSLLNIFFEKENIKDIICFLRSFKIPDELIATLFLSFRYLEELSNFIKNMETSARLRGFKKKTSLKSYKVISYFIFSLLKNMFYKTKNINDSLRLRGYSGSFPVLCKEETLNIFFLLISVIYLLLSIILSLYLNKVLKV